LREKTQKTLTLTTLLLSPGVAAPPSSLPSHYRTPALPFPWLKPKEWRPPPLPLIFNLQPEAPSLLQPSHPLTHYIRLFFASLFPLVVPFSQTKPFPSSSIFIFFAPDLPHPSLGCASLLAVTLPLSEDRLSGPSHCHFPCRTKDPSLSIPIIPFHRPPSLPSHRSPTNRPAVASPSPSAASVSPFGLSCSDQNRRRLQLPPPPSKPHSSSSPTHDCTRSSSLQPPARLPQPPGLPPEE